ncbi:hypothetical protein B2J88_32160 [Rhodococcus sp. SRB_17]|nr:hypothetical protein [Rhodococcus sp. SRB_17]
MTTNTPNIVVYVRGGNAGCFDCTGKFGAPTVGVFGYVRIVAEHDSTCPAWRNRNTPGSVLAAHSRRPAFVDGNVTVAVVEHVQRASRRM